MSDVRRIAVLAVAVLGCAQGAQSPTAKPLDLGFTGEAKLDGRSLGAHDKVWTLEPESQARGICDELAPTPGSVQLCVVEQWVGTRTGTKRECLGTLTFFPGDDQRGIDLSLQWSHASFPRAKCSRFDSQFKPTAVPHLNAGRNWDTVDGARGKLALACEDGTDTINVDVLYVCPVGTRVRPAVVEKAP